MVDCDGHRPGGDEYVDDVIDYIGYHKGEMQAVLQTVNGCHIITSRFDPREFNFKDAELKRNAFTLLYYNDISRKQE
jgi:hypothetical protein